MYRIRKQLIKTLSQALTEGVNELGEKYQAVQMLPELQKDYPTQLRPGIVSVRMYQTENACYLETTVEEFKERGLDPNEKNPAAPYEDYSRAIYRIRRESLAFLANDEQDSFWPHKSVMENAADFCDLGPSILIHFTNLINDEVANEINERYLEQKRANPDDEYEFKPGEIEFSGESLKDLDGYYSDDDPEFPKTPLAGLYIDEEITSVYLNQNDEHVRTGKLDVTGHLPTLVVMKSEIIVDQERNTTVTIPNNMIKSIKIKTSPTPDPDDSFPRKYEYHIELTTRQKIFFEGHLQEDYSQEYWYYEHKIRVE